MLVSDHSPIHTLHSIEGFLDHQAREDVVQGVAQRKQDVGQWRPQLGAGFELVTDFFRFDTEVVKKSHLLFVSIDHFEADVGEDIVEFGADLFVCDW